MVRTLQIAAVGDETDAIMVAIREYPVARLVLLHTKRYERTALDVAKKLGVLKLPVGLEKVGENILLDTMRIVTRIVKESRPQYDEIIINAASGDKMQACATLSAAFVNGVRAIGVENDACFALPVLKFSYSELISEPKLAILRTLDEKGGRVESLNELGSGTDDKSLLSYHIRGGRDSKGLEQLGLVEVDRAHQGRLIIRLTPMGKLMLLGV